MKRKLSKENPFGPNAKGYVWEYIRAQKPTNYLDYGSNQGELVIDVAKNRYAQKAVGVDLNVEAINEGKKIRLDNLDLKAIEKGKPLEFEDAYFDTISIVGVLEHIADQKSILSELRRILKPEGMLIVCVPGKHFFSFLDMGNFKFVFPRLHKFVFSLMRGKKIYHERYVECKNGLFGDIETEKMWHQHFSKKQLSALLKECGFNTVEFDGSGFFMRVILLPAPFLPGFLHKILRKVHDVDMKLFSKAEMFCVAKKA